VDSVDAGGGDVVLVSDEGNAAAQILKKGRGPIRTVIVGVVDQVDLAGTDVRGYKSSTEHAGPTEGSRRKE
jgi:hypothetical protein